MNTAIFQPMIVLVFWTFVVLLLIPRARFKAVRERRARAADFALGAKLRGFCDGTRFEFAIA